MITRTFKLCLNAGNGSAPYINVNQYDEGETWLFELYSENGERYIPSSGAIVGVKSDGHGIVNTGTVDSEGRVVITETQQMTASAGRAIYELSIDGLTHGTANFIVAVERKPTDDAVMSDSDLSLIQEAIDSAEVIVEVIGDGDPSEVIGEHVDAWLDNHPEATTTVEDGAITAPKINSTLWDKLLVSEEASGAVASFDDGADDVPVSSLKVALEPIQLGSGDPSPSNVRPIYPANSGNVLDSYGANTANGYVNDSYLTNTGSISASTNWYITEYIPVFSNHVMNIKNAVGNAPAYCFYDENKAFISGTSYSYSTNLTVTVPATARYMRLSNTFANSEFQLIDDRISVLQTGKNLLPKGVSATNVGITYDVADDGVITVNGTSTGTSFGNAGAFTLPAGSYILTGCPINSQSITMDIRNRLGGSGIALGADNGNGLAFTFSEETSGVVNIRIPSGQTVNNLIFKPMIRLASETDDTYEPYQSTSYPYTLGQSVYGGTVDLATGVLTVDRVSVIADPSLSWRYASGSGGYFYLSAAFPNLKRNGQVITNLLPTVTTSEEFASTENCVYCVTNINIKVNGVNTVSDFQTWLTTNSLQVVYEIEPTTVQLTPTEVKTLLGYNNISSTGTVDVIYHADTKLYVDKMTNVDNAIIAPTEADFVATRNYTVNDLVIVNDTLYKCTANIASGSAITPNSNATQTTLGALIKALS